MQIKEQNNTKVETKTRTRASTKTILGVSGTQPRISRKWSRHYEELTSMREEVLAKNQTLARDASTSNETSLSGEHLADVATDSYDRDWTLSMLSSGQGVFYEIQEALERISHGTYGICELTGQPIEPSRLRAIPWTRFCAAAQNELEAKGAIPRTHFGEVGDFYGKEEVKEPTEDEAEVRQSSAETKAA